MYAIKRAINGISINGDEYLLNDDGSTMIFATEKSANDFLYLNCLDYIGDVVPCEPDGVTKEIKPYPTIWGYKKNDSGDVTEVEIMIPVVGDHPELVTIKYDSTYSNDWTITSEGYD
jgi:hypothetical protein